MHPPLPPVHEAAACRLHIAADYLAAARFCLSEVDAAREYAALAMADLPADIRVQVKRAMASRDFHWLDTIASALQPPKDNRKFRLSRPRPHIPDGLRTPAQAAARLGCSEKTLKGYVAAGAIGYVVIGHGSKRPRKMFSDSDLDAFIAEQTRKDSPCPSTPTSVRRIGVSTSRSKVIAFSAVPRPRPGGKRKP
jgi:hypothetical protein